MQEVELKKKRKKCENLEHEVRKKHKRCKELVSVLVAYCYEHNGRIETKLLHASVFFKFILIRSHQCFCLFEQRHKFGAPALKAGIVYVVFQLPVA